MYAIAHEIRVKLQFPAMSAPVEVSVPLNVLHYLDTHADRYIAPDGAVVYRDPGRADVRACLLCRKLGAVAA